MGHLRDQMRMEMELRNFSPRTIKAYTWHMVAFTKHFGRSPAEMAEKDIRAYLYYLKMERKASWSGLNVGYCALKFFYVHTLHKKWPLEKLPRPKGEKRLPVVLSRSEVKAILEAIPNLKHRIFLMTTYAGGLRIGETARLKISDIDSKRLQIRVEQGKGKKDRYTLLSTRLVKELRVYWRAYRPRVWLFPGKDPEEPIATCTIQRVFKRVKKKSAFTNRLPFTLCATVLPPIC